MHYRLFMFYILNGRHSYSQKRDMCESRARKVFKGAKSSSGVLENCDMNEFTLLFPLSNDTKEFC